MNRFIYPIILVTVIAILAGAAFWHYYAPSDIPKNPLSSFDNDGDRDDPSHATSSINEATGPTTSTSNTPSVPTSHTSSPGDVTASAYTMAQVRMHASSESCWTAIAGNVYDLTSWITKHPGGKSAILQLCGTDGTQAFNDQHGGQARPEQELATFKIGALTQ